MSFFRPAERYAQVGLRAARALEWCGLAARGDAIAGRLSYGEQRQLEIAMMLATEPSLLLLDEPLAGLGHDEALRIVELLRKVARGRTVVLVEDGDGKVLATGSPSEIRASPAVREAYLGEEIP